MKINSMNEFLPFFFLSFSFRRNKCQSAIVENIDFKVKVIDNLIHV